MNDAMWRAFIFVVVSFVVGMIADTLLFVHDSRGRIDDELDAYFFEDD